MLAIFYLFPPSPPTLLPSTLCPSLPCRLPKGYPSSCITQAPLPSGLQLVLVNGEHQQEIRRWEERERLEYFFPVLSLHQYHSSGRGQAVMPPWPQLSLGSGHRPRAGNGFPLLVASGSLNMQGLSHKASYERKAWRKEEGERDTETGKQVESKTEKERNILEMIKWETLFLC